MGKITAGKTSYCLIEEWRKNSKNAFIVGEVLTDLSKAFNCTSHDLLIAKLSVYNISGLILYNRSINDLFLFVVLASQYNLADEISCLYLLPQFQD